jgi:hypothetical protein
LLERRDFITLLGGVAVASRSRRVRSKPLIAPAYRVLLDEMGKLGFSEGQNLIIDLRSATGVANWQEFLDRRWLLLFNLR